MNLQHIEAVIFDMDGTLVDSEHLTDRTVQWLLESHGLGDGGFDCTQCYGTTWKFIESLLKDHFPQLANRDLVAPLRKKFHSLSVEIKPDAIPGASEAVQSAYRVASTAIVTSSNQESLDEVVQRLKLASFLTTTVTAEDYNQGKPAPDCYLLVAKRLGVNPRHCLVFEDSAPGIQSAKAAGMTVIAVTHRCATAHSATKLADKTITNYMELPSRFFGEACRQ